MCSLLVAKSPSCSHHPLPKNHGDLPWLVTPRLTAYPFTSIPPAQLNQSLTDCHPYWGSSQPPSEPCTSPSDFVLWLGHNPLPSRCFSSIAPIPHWPQPLPRRQLLLEWGPMARFFPVSFVAPHQLLNWIKHTSPATLVATSLPECSTKKRLTPGLLSRICCLASTWICCSTNPSSFRSKKCLVFEFHLHLVVPHSLFCLLGRLATAAATPWRSAHLSTKSLLNTKKRLNFPDRRQRHGHPLPSFTQERESEGRGSLDLPDPSVGWTKIQLPYLLRAGPPSLNGQKPKPRPTILLSTTTIILT